LRFFQPSNPLTLTLVGFGKAWPFPQSRISPGAEYSNGIRRLKLPRLRSDQHHSEAFSGIGKSAICARAKYSSGVFPIASSQSVVKVAFQVKAFLCFSLTVPYSGSQEGL
jgi:hypothetical protein